MFANKECLLSQSQIRNKILSQALSQSLKVPELTDAALGPVTVIEHRDQGNFSEDQQKTTLRSSQKISKNNTKPWTAVTW